MADAVQQQELSTLYKYFSYYDDASNAANETVYHCGSKITIYLGENKLYNDGRCMLTNNYLVWRNTSHSDNKRIRILFLLKHIKMMTVKSHAGKLSAFATPKLMIYLNELGDDETPSDLYIQLAFRNGNDSRNLFAKRLQSIMGQHHITQEEKTDETRETLRNIVYKEDIIDAIHEQYIKLTVTEFTNAIQALYFIQNYNATQNTVKLQNMRAASEVITRFVRYDNNTHHHKLSEKDKKTICDTYFNYEPYLEIQSPSKMQSYTSYHCHRFLDLNSYVFKLFKHIFPIKVSLKTQQEWIETLLRCQWYLNDEYQSTVIHLIDTLINEIWSVKFVPMDHINFNDKTDLRVIKHLLSNYCHPENIPNHCHFKDLAQIYLLNAHKEELDVCLVSVLNIAALRERFAVVSVHEVMEELVRKHKYTKNDYVVLQLVKYVRARSNELDIDLQHLLKGVIDEDEALKLIELNLMINDKLIYLKWKDKYNGFNAIQYAQSKQVKPVKIIEFLATKMEKYEENIEYKDADDDDNDIEAKDGDVAADDDGVMIDVDLDVNNATAHDNNVATKNDLMDIMQNICDIQKDIKSMNELQSKIYLELMENKSNNENMNQTDDDLDVNQMEEELEKYNEALIDEKEWRNWSYLEIIQYLMSIEDGKYAQYRNIWFKNMRKREMRGIDLAVMEKKDWSDFFDVTNFGDLCSLWNDIQTLIQ